MPSPRIGSCLNDIENTFKDMEALGIMPQTENLPNDLNDEPLEICLSLNGNIYNSSMLPSSGQDYNQFIYTFGELFYAYVTPFIITLGLIGNCLSLSVFVSKAMRKMSASLYLAALSITDTSVLIVFVLFDWLAKGLKHWTGHVTADIINVNGICQLFLYFSYTLRFASVWLIVIFTIERYIGVCLPLKRLRMCNRNSAKRAVFICTLMALSVSIYKPILSGVYTIKGYRDICTHNPRSKLASFVLDALFGILITLIPFLIICSLNYLMTRKLYLRMRKRKENVGIVHEHKIRMEFTIILMGVSMCFIALNLPYFIVWCFHMYNTFYSNFNEYSDVRYLRGVLSITKTIFFLNYCINFVLYSITGACFRKELCAIFKNHRLRRQRSRTKMSSRSSYDRSLMQSWV